jgi:hypothetical protein
MAKISDFKQVLPLLNEIKERSSRAASLEQAGREVVDLLFDRLGDSLVLARLFATVPYGQLPSENRTFVDRLTAQHNVKPLVNHETPILSLLASRGTKPGWNDRRQSKGHVGIPLASADFVNSVPMIARLLGEVGLELSWLGADSAGVEISTMSKVSGVFYVRDAASAVDQQGRRPGADPYGQTRPADEKGPPPLPHRLA